MNTWDWSSNTYTCGRMHCTCSHQDPCDRGWIQHPEGGVRPCAACKPEVAIIFNTARSNFERNARMLARGVRKDG